MVWVTAATSELIATDELGIGAIQDLSGSALQPRPGIVWSAAGPRRLLHEHCLEQERASGSSQATEALPNFKRLARSLAAAATRFRRQPRSSGGFSRSTPEPAPAERHIDAAQRSACRSVRPGTVASSSPDRGGLSGYPTRQHLVDISDVVVGFLPGAVCRWRVDNREKA